VSRVGSIVEFACGEMLQEFSRYILIVLCVNLISLLIG